MGRKRLQTRADADTADAVEDYADDHDLTQSEAVRRMIRSGLTQHGYEIATADGMGVGQLDQLADQLDSIEQRQAARANQRERLDVAQNVSLVAGLSYVVAVAGLGASGPLWTVVGVMVIISIAAAQLWARRLEDSE